MSTIKLTLLNKELLGGGSGEIDGIRSAIGGWSAAAGTPAYKLNDSNIEVNVLRTKLNDFESSFGATTFPDNAATQAAEASLAAATEFHFEEQRIEIGIPAADKTADLLFKNLLLLIKENIFYEDFATVVRIPSTLKSGNQAHSARVNYEYNFLDKSYEKELQKASTDLVEIPSMYHMVSVANTNTLEENSLSAGTVKQLISNKRNTRFRRKFKRQMVIGRPKRTIGIWEDNKFLFPMYTEINVPTGRDKRIARDIQDTDLAAILMRDIIETPNLNSRQEANLLLYVDLAGNPRRHELKADTIDLKDYWISDIGAWAAAPPLPGNSMFISQGTTSDIVPDKIVPTLQEVLADQEGSFPLTVQFGMGTVALRGKIDGILEEHARSHSDLLRKGKLAHSEILMYKVSKFKGNQQKNPAQEFFFYNAGTDAQEDAISFVDTQVQYNREYTYIITAYVAVVGSKYFYKGVKRGKDSWEYRDGKVFSSFKVVTMPTIRLVEVPIFSSTGRISAPPPCYPQVNIEQIKGYTKGMLFSFDTQVGETYEEPVSLSDAEESINEQFLNDDTKSIDGKILYRTTMAMNGVEVYRVATKPEDYMDFKGKLLRTIRTDVDLASDLSAGSVAKRIKQPPNKKFYYMFRSFGFHGEQSNPSPVYEVELYSDGGVAYPIVRLYEFKERDRKTSTKPMRNLLRITPRITQAMVNEAASGLVSESGQLQNAIDTNIVLGVEDDSLFGKTFKIRITSRDTGKRMDLNISFTTKVVKAQTGA